MSDEVFKGNAIISRSNITDLNRDNRVPLFWRPGQKRLLKVINDEKFETVTELCKKAKVSRQVYYSAVRSKEFIDAVLQDTDAKMNSNVPQIVDKMIDQAKQGSYPQQKMILEMTKVYNADHPDSQINMQVNFNWKTDEPVEGRPVDGSQIDTKQDETNQE